MSIIASTVLPIILLQIGPNPMFGQIEDHSAMVQDRPPREPRQQELDFAQPDPAALIGAKDDGWLTNCLELVETDPARAHVQAQLRRSETSGADQVVANYCLGLAAINLELFEDALSAFTSARDDTDQSELSLRARFGIMAGNAALADQRQQHAAILLSEAERDAEAAGNGRLAAFAALDQARILVARGETAQAETKLAAATRLDPQSAEAWLLSATLMRRLERLVEAQQMIEQASILSPSDPDIALEAGVIAVLSGGDDAARSSWNSVIDLAPDSPQADAARAYLAQLAGTAPSP
ncbi:tetratricopeptide repeat protein [Altererythrobacter sp. GH1-8]|uniref:tetratricopeptide repeat protein n=1 Tax=Altererythrobacter sp. GH1-8 TaxID=3349333 RepID=UPI00374CC30E